VTRLEKKGGRSTESSRTTRIKKVVASLSKRKMSVGAKRLRIDGQTFEDVVSSGGGGGGGGLEAVPPLTPGDDGKLVKANFDGTLSSSSVSEGATEIKVNGKSMELDFDQDIKSGNNSIIVSKSPSDPSLPNAMALTSALGGVVFGTGVNGATDNLTSTSTSGYVSLVNNGEVLFDNRGTGNVRFETSGGEIKFDSSGGQIKLDSDGGAVSLETNNLENVADIKMTGNIDAQGGTINFVNTGFPAIGVAGGVDLQNTGFIYRCPSVYAENGLVLGSDNLATVIQTGAFGSRVDRLTIGPGSISVGTPTDPCLLDMNSNNIQGASLVQTGAIGSNVNTNTITMSDAALGNLIVASSDNGFLARAGPPPFYNEMGPVATGVATIARVGDLLLLNTDAGAGGITIQKTVGTGTIVLASSNPIRVDNTDLDMNSNNITNVDTISNASNSSITMLESTLGNSLYVTSIWGVTLNTGSNRIFIQPDGVVVRALSGDTDIENKSAGNDVKLQSENGGNIVLKFLSGGPTDKVSIENGFLDMNSNAIQNVSGINGLTAVGGLYASTSAGTIINTTVATSLTPTTSVGSLSIPADGFAAGDCFHLVVSGDCEFANGDEVQITVLNGATVLAQTPIFETEDASTGDNVFEIEADFNIRSTGAGGSIHSSFEFTYNKNGVDSKDFRGTRANDTQNIDTTVASTLDVQFKFNSKNAGSFVTTQLFRLQKVY